MEETLTVQRSNKPEAFTAFEQAGRPPFIQVLRERLLGVARGEALIELPCEGLERLVSPAPATRAVRVAEWKMPPRSGAKPKPNSPSCRRKVRHGMMVHPASHTNFRHSRFGSTRTLQAPTSRRRRIRSPPRSACTAVVRQPLDRVPRIMTSNRGKHHGEAGWEQAWGSTRKAGQSVAGSLAAGPSA